MTVWFVLTLNREIKQQGPREPAGTPFQILLVAGFLVSFLSFAMGRVWWPALVFGVPLVVLGFLIEYKITRPERRPRRNPTKIVVAAPVMRCCRTDG